ncbi:hypothetical protein ACR777_20120 [Sphingobacterium spiritivorum]|uniref:hypothetical protein n=1 Tax=Sphingobacterium spiritivorum TaxID=258 RepID=UPI003DA5A154
MKEIIGVVIKESIRKSDMTQEDFAKEMGMTLRNLANLFNKEHIPIEQLVRASKIMKQDFIKVYTEWLYEKEPKIRPHENEDIQPIYPDQYLKNEMTIFLNVKGSFDDIKNNMTDFLEIVKKEAEERGLHLA